MSDRTRLRVGRFAAELLVIFAGVSAAFFVEDYREDRQERQELEEAVDGILFELDHYVDGNRRWADSAASALAAWRAEDAAGRRAVPATLIIPGALRPPHPAWQAAVASGTVNRIEPGLRLDLGWFYSELLGVHENYVRQVEFAERELLPRARLGAEAFYGPDGDLRPEFAFHMQQIAVFEEKLRQHARWADSLRTALRASRGR